MLAGRGHDGNGRRMALLLACYVCVADSKQLAVSCVFDFPKCARLLNHAQTTRQHVAQSILKFLSIPARQMNTAILVD